VVAQPEWADPPPQACGDDLIDHSVEQPGAGSPHESGGAETVTKVYYAIAGQSVAVRMMTTGSSTLNYLLTDHLGSVAAVTDEDGALVSEQRYYPLGQVCTDVGSITETDFGYTG
jgi:hypothetical protein